MYPSVQVLPGLGNSIYRLKPIGSSTANFARHVVSVVQNACAPLSCFVELHCVFELHTASMSGLSIHKAALEGR